MVMVNRVEARAVLALAYTLGGDEWAAAHVLAQLCDRDLEQIRAAAGRLSMLAAPLLDVNALRRTRMAATQATHEHVWSRDRDGSYCLFCPEETPEREDLRRGQELQDAAAAGREE